MIGQGSIGFNNLFVQQVPPGPPFVATSADNGLSIDPVSGRIVIGQAVGAVGDPGQLLSNREIPLKGFTFSLGEAGSQHFIVNPTARVYSLGDLSGGVGNGSQIGIDDANQAFDYQTITSGHLFNISGIVGNASLGDLDFNGTGFQFFLDYTNQAFRVITGAFPGSQLFNLNRVAGLYQVGDIDTLNNGAFLSIDDTNTNITFQMLGGRQLHMQRSLGNDFYILGDADLLNSGLQLQMISNGAVSGRAVITSLAGDMLDLDQGAGTYTMGDVGATINNTRLTVNDSAGVTEVRARGNNPFAVEGSTTLIRTYTALSNAAAAAVATLNNSPVAGDPTKWISINDNGTVRRIPCW